MKQLPFGSLPNDVQVRLNQLLQQSPEGMTPAELAFLRGRRDYLSAEQRKYYGLDKENKLPAPNSGEEEKFDREAAKARLKELEVDFKGNASNETLKELLADAESPVPTGGDDEGDE